MWYLQNLGKIFIFCLLYVFYVMMLSATIYENFLETLKTTTGAPDEGKTAQWGIIELQGDLISQSGNDLHGQFVGDLHYTKQGSPILIIGHHILSGKEIIIEKPFAVLEKRRYTDRSQITASPGGNLEILQTEYIVRAIIKKKLLFKVRPKPIISNVLRPA